MNNKPDRQSTRLHDFDYSSAGAYFITICAHNRECLFGDIVDGVMRLNEVGRVIADEWQKTAVIRPSVTLDQFIVMPNHFHAIIFINDVGATRWVARSTDNRSTTRATHRVAPTNLASNSLGAIIGQFKSAVSRQLKRAGHHPQTPVWQRNYYDHVIRNEKSLQEIRDYIQNNPMKWELDRNHPDNF